MIPTYNRAHTLARALASVFAQTRPADEVIVVDDGSTDGTDAVVRGFPRARLIQLEANRGAAAARNAGARQARGDYIAFLDSDDAWMSEKIELQLDRMGRHSAPDLLCTAIRVQENEGARRVYQAPAPLPGKGWTFREFRTYSFSTSTWLIRRDTFFLLGGFDESLANCEDLDFLARLVGAERRIEAMPDVLTDKFDLADSLDVNRERTARSYEVIFPRHETLWAKSPLAAATAYRRLANMHIRARDMRSARLALWSAVCRAPLHIRFWLHLTLTLLGYRGYAHAQRWAAWLRLAYWRARSWLT